MRSRKENRKNERVAKKQRKRFNEGSDANILTSNRLVCGFAAFAGVVGLGYYGYYALTRKVKGSEVSLGVGFEDAERAISERLEYYDFDRNIAKIGFVEGIPVALDSEGSILPGLYEVSSKVVKILKSKFAGPKAKEEFFLGFFRAYYESSFLRERIDLLLSMENFSIFLLKDKELLFGEPITVHAKAQQFGNRIVIAFNFDKLLHTSSETEFANSIKHEVMHAVDIVTNKRLVSGLNAFACVNENEAAILKDEYEACIANLQNSAINSSSLLKTRNFALPLKRESCDVMRRYIKEGDTNLMVSNPLPVGSDYSKYYDLYLHENLKSTSTIAACAVEVSFANIEYYIDVSKMHFYDTEGQYGGDVYLSYSEGATHLLDSIRTSTFIDYCPGFVEYYENRASGVLSDNARGL